MKEKALMIWQTLDKPKKITSERRQQIIKRLKAQKHKAGVNPDDWDRVLDNLLIIAEFDLNLCEGLSLPVEYTSIIRERLAVSTSDSHSQRRAYDRTLRGWPEGIASWFAELVNDGLTVGAVSRSDGKERESVFEDDEFKIVNGEKVQVKWKHLHFQCRA